MRSTIQCECGRKIDITDQLDADLRLIADHQAAEIKQLKEELERLQNAVAYLRQNITQNAGNEHDPFAYVWQRVWEEFERRVSK